jgi:hypothetical protein
MAALLVLGVGTYLLQSFTVSKTLAQAQQVRKFIGSE